MLAYSPSPVRVVVHCENCQREVGLLCEGLAGPYGYPGYVDFTCPHCAKLTRHRTPGRILSIQATAA